MSDKYGLVIADEGGSVTHGRPRIDSRRRTLIVDLDREPPHMKIVPLDKVGTAWTDDGSVLGRRQEVLYRIKHNLGFVPLVGAYFYESVSQGYGNDVYYLSGAAGTYSDVLSFEADAAEFRIVHNFDAHGFTTHAVSPLPTLAFRVKYYIYSINTYRSLALGYHYDGLGQLITS